MFSLRRELELQAHAAWKLHGTMWESKELGLSGEVGRSDCGRFLDSLLRVESHP